MGGGQIRDNEQGRQRVGWVEKRVVVVVKEWQRREDRGKNWSWVCSQLARVEVRGV